MNVMWWIVNIASYRGGYIDTDKVEHGDDNLY